MSRKRNRLKALARLIPDHRKTVAKLVELEVGGHNDSDRAIAIVGAAFVDNAVKVVIKAHSLTYDYDEEAVFGAQGPLYSFASKITMGHALGIYGPKTRSDLDAIRNIRNAFAHALEDIDFLNSEIANECDKLNHTGKIDLALVLRGAKGKYVRAVINISDALRVKVATQGVLKRFRFPDDALP